MIKQVIVILIPIAAVIANELLGGNSVSMLAGGAVVAAGVIIGGEK